MRLAWLAALALVLAGCAAPAEPTAPVRAAAPKAPAAEEPPEPPRGRVLELARVRTRSGADRRVRVWLPPGHDPGAPHPVLYVLDGQAASTLRVPQALERLLADGLIEPWIAVFVESGRDRRRELAVRAEDTADWIAEVVAPGVASRFAVRSDPPSAAILGYSFGGLCAVRAALHRPETFGRVIAMSPSLWWRDRELARVLPRERARLPHRMWLDAGTLEGDPGEIVPYVVHDVRTLRDAAIEGGMVMGQDLGTLEALAQPHDFAAGGRRMEEALAFALSDKDYATLTPREVRVITYPVPRGAAWQTFAVEARYGGVRRMTWPARDVELSVRGGARELAGALVRPLGDAELVARVRGVGSQHSASAEVAATPAARDE